MPVIDDNLLGLFELGSLLAFSFGNFSFWHSYNMKHLFNMVLEQSYNFQV
jgi:hypothetical protein